MKDIALVLVVVAGCVMASGVLAAALVALSARRSGRSFQAEALISIVLPLLNRARKTSTSQGRLAAIAANRKAGEAMPPASVSRRFRFHQQDVDGGRVFGLGQKGGRGDLHILYLHGGGFELHLLAQHWTIIAGLADRLPADVTIPLYPLVPEHDHKPAYALVERVYHDLVSRVGAERLVIAGDSAGGGLALSFCQRLHARGGQMPAAMVLFSPWGDLTVSDPAQTEIARRDLLLSISRTRAAGKQWAGALAPDDPRVNPLSASMEGLPSTLILTGTDDILNADAHRLMASARAAGADFTLSEYPGMPHSWPVVPVPEGRAALDEAAAFIERHVGGT